MLDPHAPVLDAARPELMLRPGWSRQCEPALLSGSTVVCGCEGGDAVREGRCRGCSPHAPAGARFDALNLLAED
ncbi:MAG: bifunctional ADP-dependent NAD(P)H-hydrate dehydratase/NAD(P)H-hydrate epimerase, partial [Comamonadaceae bacterium]|nr:bifunctional ADP-dependent NAD(P)H-hydrate dehydratase/NAD(P)H-hydrate epimerase [Comamonadaceae bacterium]